MRNLLHLWGKDFIMQVIELIRCYLGTALARHC